MCKYSCQKDGGYVLFLVMSIMFILQALLMGYVILAKIDKGTTVAATNSSQGFSNSEAGLNRRAEDIRQKFNNYGQPGGTSPTGSTSNERRNSCIDSSTTNDGSGDFMCQEHVFSNATSGESRKTKTYVFAENSGAGTLVRIPSGQAFAGLNAQEYSYRIGSSSYSGDDAKPEAILEMRMKNRLVPLFQFAAFYKDDLEIRPGPTMTLNGPVHTNKDLYLGSGATLTIKGQITTIGSIYSKSKADNGTSADGSVKVFDGSSDRKLLDAADPANTPTTSAMDVAKLKSLWNKRILPGIEEVQIPATSVLDNNGDYYENADLRIEFKPNDNATSNPVKVAVTAINRSTSTPTINTLTEGQLRSLRQPVLTSLKCTPGTPITNTLTTLQKADIAKALQIYLSSNKKLLKVSQLPMSAKLSSFPTGDLDAAPGANSIHDLIVAQSSLSEILWDSIIKNLTIQQVADLSGKCFKAAPLSISSFYNYREDRTIQLLHVNFESLTAWNKDGIYVNFSNGDVIGQNFKQGFSANQVLFNLAAADTGATNNSFQKLGYAASDRSHGGLVIHASVDDGTATDAESNQSPYGFALVDGKELPGLATTTTTLDPTGLTFATNQAVYTVGHYNNFNYQPAGILSDSMNVLSNACVDTNRFIDCSVARGTNKHAATATTVNAAFLSGVDETLPAKYNGGLENYPRFHENWSSITFTYRGSFVSLNIPQHVSGAWPGTGPTTYNPPTRAWDYDDKFNEFKNLPPMTPNLVYLWQENFGRVLEQ
jgi:hypothetical protein